MAVEMGNNNIGNGVLIATGSVSFTTWLTNNATVISLSLTFLSLIVGGVFLYLNWRTNSKHKKVMEGIALRELQLKEQAALHGSLKD